MICINFQELYSPMLQAKFLNRRPSGSGEEDLSRFLKLSFLLPKDVSREVWRGFANPFSDV